MIRALLTWPWRSKRLRTPSSEALKSRLPTNMFFTLVSCQFESGAYRWRSHKPDSSQVHSAGFAEACQTRFEYNTGRKGWANKIGEKRVQKKTKGLRRKAKAFELNRATSYSPTHLRVQYHRG